MHGDGGSRRALMVEILAVDLIVSGEVIHIYEKNRYLGDVAQTRPGTGENVAHILDCGTSLHTDVETCCAQLVHVGSGDGIVGTSGTRPRDEQEIPGALHVRIRAAGLRFALQHGRFHYAARLHHFSYDVRVEYKCCSARNRSLVNACRLRGQYPKVLLLRTACAGRARTSNSPR